MRSLVAVFLVSAMFPACWASFSPPPRITHYGAPGRLKAGEMEIGVASSMTLTPPITTTTKIGGLTIQDETDMYYSVVGTPSFAIALNDLLQLEATCDLGSWAMGGLGIRLNWRKPKHSVSGDLELGASVGAGGLRYGESVPVDLRDNLAGGAYLGAGIARYFGEKNALFFRVRVQGSQAEGLPSTFWGSGLLGFDFNTHDTVNINFGVGFVCYSNSTSGLCGFLFDVGLAVKFEVFTPQKHPRQEGEEPLVESKARHKDKQVTQVPGKEKLEVQKTKPTAEKTEDPSRPCPPETVVLGGSPPKAFEQYCAKRDPQGGVVHHGWYTGYYENGKKASEGKYSEGLRDGKWTFWYDSGQVRLEAHYRMGKKHDRWVFRDRDGAEVRVVKYADDLELGED